MLEDLEQYYNDPELIYEIHTRIESLSSVLGISYNKISKFKKPTKANRKGNLLFEYML